MGMTTYSQYVLMTGSAADGNKIEFLNAAATGMIQKYCNRFFSLEDITAEKHRGTGHCYLQVLRPPIVEIDEIRIGGSVVDEDDYFIIDNQENIFSEGVGVENPGLIFKASGWTWVPGYHQDMTHDPDPNSSDYNIEIDYTGGYVFRDNSTQENPMTIPNDLEYACIMLMQYLENLSPGLQSERVGNYSYSVSSMTEKAGVPSQVRMILDRYKRVAVA